jgi:hypothetical protein
MRYCWPPFYFATIAVLAIGSTLVQTRAAGADAKVKAPRFEVDPLWPKPLPNHWVMGSVVGVSVDSNDHIWITHRVGSLERMETYAAQNPPAADCCVPAPPILEFNEAGDLIGHWGGPGEGYDWPASAHGITVDYKGNVWLGGNGRGAVPDGRGGAVDGRGGRAGTAITDESRMGAPGPVHDSMVLKFTQTGKFLMQIGKPGQSQGSNDTANLRLPAKTLVDPKTNELYVADGYGNRRIIVFDADTGAYKRHWGAYGHKPDDAQLPSYTPGEPPPQQFRTPVHCVALSNDGLVYVCDRVNDRIQVFKTDGTFVKEAFLEKNTKGDGAPFDIAFSPDAEQKYMYIPDGSNMKIHILQRDTMEELTTFGDGGRQPGQFYAVHSIATDSKGNIFTTETYRGQRVQKFIYKGIASVSKDQGVVWPQSK